MQTLKEPVIEEYSTSTSTLQYALRLPPNLIYFQGHFPGHPVLPGVVQVDWAIKLGASLLAANQQFSHLLQLKFTKPLTPDQRITLELSKTKKVGTISFRYFDDTHKYSSGLLVFNADLSTPSVLGSDHAPSDTK